MKRYIFIVAAIATAAAAQAQTDGGLSKQLEVTREYTPRVGQAMKLSVVPDMTDTVRLRPEVSYNITSTASATSFSTSPFEAASMSVAPFSVRRPLYVRIGAGMPFMTEADIYFTPRMRTGSTFGIFANHSGSYSKIRNDLGVKASAAEMTNGVGLWGGRQWKRYSLAGDISYDNRRYNPYGVAPIDPNPTSSLLRDNSFAYDKGTDRFSLGLLRGGVSFGDNFTDLSRLNFRAALDGGVARLEGEDEIRLDVRLTAAKMFGAGKHGFELEIAERGAFGPVMDDATEGSDVVQQGGAVTVSILPHYVLRTGVWGLKAGVDARYISNKAHGQSTLGFAPFFEARANLAGGAFVPFLSYTSRVIEGDREALSRRNPYVTANGATALVSDARVGFSGDLGDLFSYKLFGGASLMKDYQLLVGDQYATWSEMEGTATVDYRPMRFTPVSADGMRYTAGAEVGVHNLGGFGARVYGNWNGFDFDQTFAVGDLPKYDAGVELSYRHGDAVSLRLGAEFVGQREYLVRAVSQIPTDSFNQPVTYTIESAVDVTFGADVLVVRDFWVFLEGKNLAGQRLYPYPHYRGLGASVLGGIKVVF